MKNRKLLSLKTLARVLVLSMSLITAQAQAFVVTGSIVLWGTVGLISSIYGGAKVYEAVTAEDDSANANGNNNGANGQGSGSTQLPPSSTGSPFASGAESDTSLSTPGFTLSSSPDLGSASVISPSSTASKSTVSTAVPSVTPTTTPRAEQGAYQKLMESIRGKKKGKESKAGQVNSGSNTVAPSKTATSSDAVSTTEITPSSTSPSKTSVVTPSATYATSSKAESILATPTFESGQTVVGDTSTKARKEASQLTPFPVAGQPEFEGIKAGDQPPINRPETVSSGEVAIIGMKPSNVSRAPGKLEEFGRVLMDYMHDAMTRKQKGTVLQIESSRESVTTDDVDPNGLLDSQESARLRAKWEQENQCANPNGNTCAAKPQKPQADESGKNSVAEKAGRPQSQSLLIKDDLNKYETLVNRTAVVDISVKICEEASRLTPFPVAGQPEFEGIKAGDQAPVNRPETVGSGEVAIIGMEPSIVSRAPRKLEEFGHVLMDYMRDAMTRKQKDAVLQIESSQEGVTADDVDPNGLLDPRESARLRAKWEQENQCANTNGNTCAARAESKKSGPAEGYSEKGWSFKTQVMELKKKKSKPQAQPQTLLSDDELRQRDAQVNAGQPIKTDAQKPKTDGKTGIASYDLGLTMADQPDSYRQGMLLAEKPDSYRQGLLKQMGFLREDESKAISKPGKSPRQKKKQKTADATKGAAAQGISEKGWSFKEQVLGLKAKAEAKPQAQPQTLLSDDELRQRDAQVNAGQPVKVETQKPKTDDKTGIASYDLGLTMADQPDSYRQGMLLAEKPDSYRQGLLKKMGFLKKDQSKAVNASTRKTGQSKPKKPGTTTAQQGSTGSKVSEGTTPSFSEQLKQWRSGPGQTPAILPENRESESENERDPFTAEDNRVDEDRRREERHEHGEDTYDEPLKEDLPVPDRMTGSGNGTVISSSAEASLQAARAMNHASGMMVLETMSGFRNAMGLYRNGRMFSFGSASLDDVSTDELLASNDPVSNAADFNRETGSWHSFVQVHGMKADRDDIAGLPGGSLTGQGLTTGVFYQLDPELITGVMLSVHKSTYSYKDSLGSGALESVRVGPFVSWNHNDFHLDAALTIGHNGYELKRKDAPGQQLKSKFSGTDFTGYIGVGYDLHLDNWAQGLTLTPMAELLYIRSNHGSYSEEGTGAEKMNVGGGATGQLIARYGIETSYLFPNLENPTELKIRLGMQHHNVSGQHASYQLQNGESGRLNLPSYSENAAFMGLGFFRKVGDYSHISLNYNGTRSKNGLSHGVQFNYEMKF